MWTITGAVVAPRLLSYGFAGKLDEAKTAFARRGASGSREKARARIGQNGRARPCIRKGGQLMLVLRDTVGAYIFASR
jgi:hypothetical protein